VGNLENFEKFDDFRGGSSPVWGGVPNVSRGSFFQNSEGGVLFRRNFVILGASKAVKSDSFLCGSFGG